MEQPVPADKQLAETLRRMQTEIDELKGARSGGFTTLAQGTFAVTDAAGVVRARLGLLDDGDYGIEVDDAAGTPISIGASLFGLDVVEASGFTTLTTTTLVDVGPTTTVAVPPSGRILVIAFAILTARTDATNTTTAYTLANLMIDGVSNLSLLLEARFVGTAAGQGLEEISVAGFHIFTLTPGDHDFSIGAKANNIPVATSKIGPRGLLFFPL